MTLPRTLALHACCLALILTLASQARAQDGGLTWEPIPGPYGGAAYAIASVTDDDAVVAIASDGDRLYRSDDGGAWWEPLDLDQSGVLSLLAASNGDFWAAGQSLLRSTDGGLTWAEAGEGLPPGRATGLSAASDGTLYAATNSGLYRRTPAASAWAPTAFPHPVLSVAVGPEGTLLTSTYEPVGDDSFIVYRSTDGGDTWEPIVLIPDAYATVQALAFLDDGTALTGGVSGPYGGTTPGLFRSTDGGLTWTALPDFPEAETEAFYPAPGVIHAETRFDGSLRSTDGGLTWEPAAWEPADLRAYGAAAGPGGSVLLATSALGVLRSDDGGQTWDDATEGFGRAVIGNLVLGEQGRVYAAAPGLFGSSTGLYRSTDGGQNWARRSLPFTPAGVYDLHLTSDGVLLLAPEHHSFPTGTIGGGLFRSTDGGETWEDVSQVDGAGRLRGVPHLGEGPDGSLWALIGLNYFHGRFVFRSTDGGRTWEERAEAPFSAMAFTVGPDGSLWAGSGQPGVRVARSTDGAETWEVVLDTAETLVSAIAVTPSGAVVVSARDTDYRSPDFGATWDTVDLNLGEEWMDVEAFVQTGNGVIYGGVDGPPAVVRSLDDGVTWEPVAEGLPTGSYSYSDLALAADGHLWSANGRRGLYRTSQPVTVAAEQAPPLAAGLTVTTFPNPFEQRATVALATGAAHRHIEVEVLDVLGRRVITLYAGPLGAGHHVFHLDGGSLSAGTYFVRVGSENGVTASGIVLAR